MEAPLDSTIDCDLCVIGAGSGGLSLAAGAAQMGARVVLIEKHKMGGDCLNYGCVPSKALIAAAQAAHGQRRAAAFGVAAREPEIDFAKVHAHVHGVIAAIAPHDSVERFTGLGVKVVLDTARFTGPDEVAAGAARIRARWFVIATGSRPSAPPIPGLAETPHLTNETVFDLKVRPDHLIVAGGGPIGCELAQAFRRLGSRVTVVEMAGLLGKDDPELVEIVRRQLATDGVVLRESAKMAAAQASGGGVAVTIERGGASETISGSHLLIAAGRQPNVEDLDLGKAGVEFTKKGVTVDRRLRTSNARVFAIGDAAGGLMFTHLSNYHAQIVIRQALFRLFWTSADAAAVPWVTYTDPELAQVGLTEAEARKARGDIRVLRSPLIENDRAQTERATDGLIKVVTARNGRVLGASIVGRHAGDLVYPWIGAVQRKQKIGALANIIAPYPTFSEITKRAAGSFYTPALFSERTKKIVRFLLRLP